MQPQQTANNTQRLMKRRSNGISLQPHLFFSHPFVGRHAFVERLFRVHFEYIKMLYINFNSSTLFYPSTSPLGKWQE